MCIGQCNTIFVRVSRNGTTIYVFSRGFVVINKAVQPRNTGNYKNKRNIKKRLEHQLALILKGNDTETAQKLTSGLARSLAGGGA